MDLINEYNLILSKISLNFVPRDLIENWAR